MCVARYISITASANKYAPYEKDLSKTLDDLYSGKRSLDTLDMKSVNRFHKELFAEYTDGLGYSFEDLDPSDPKWAELAKSEANLYSYSAHKNNAYNQSLKDLRSLSKEEFKEAAELLHKTHYGRYSDAERQNARAMGDQKRQWADIEEHGEIMPYLTYRTAGDDRVRLQHKAWNNITLHYKHPFWKTNFPPNGFGCRCIVTQDFEIDPELNEQAQLAEIKKVDKPDEGFRNNPGIQTAVFNQEETYFKIPLKEEANQQLCAALKHQLNGFLPVTKKVRVSPAIGKHELSKNIEAAIKLSDHIEESITLSPSMPGQRLKNPDLHLSKGLADIKKVEKITATSIQNALSSTNKQLAKILIIDAPGTLDLIASVITVINSYRNINKNVNEIWFLIDGAMILYRKNKEGYYKKGAPN